MCLTLTQTTLDSNFQDGLQRSIGRHEVSYLKTKKHTRTQKETFYFKKNSIKLTITHRQTNFLLSHESSIGSSHTTDRSKV